MLLNQYKQNKRHGNSNGDNSKNKKMMMVVKQ